MIQNQITADLFIETEYEFKDPFCWDIVGKNLVFLFIEAFVFFTLNILWEMFQETSHSISHENSHCLVLENVSKTYKSVGKKFVAVQGMNMTVSKGECFALIGLNGAGKSTTFQMIVGKAKLSGGIIQQTCQHIGFCPQSNSLDMKISVKNLLKIYSTISGFHGNESVALANHLIRAYDLEVYSEVLCGELSGGNKRKVCVAISTISHPDLILMDEPTSGMDPKSRRIIWERIKENIREGQEVLPKCEKKKKFFSKLKGQFAPKFLASHIFLRDLCYAILFFFLFQ
jgi:ABC-type Mn2+/Zn2+ transport system ATPase subunit